MRLSEIRPLSCEEIIYVGRILLARGQLNPGRLVTYVHFCIQQIRKRPRLAIELFIELGTFAYRTIRPDRTNNA